MAAPATVIKANEVLDSTLSNAATFIKARRVVAFEVRATKNILHQEGKRGILLVQKGNGLSLIVI